MCIGRFTISLMFNINICLYIKSFNTLMKHELLKVKETPIERRFKIMDELSFLFLQRNCL